MSQVKRPRLRPLLTEGLEVVFVGTEPGLASLDANCYYADPTNAFYMTLRESGWTERQLTFREFREHLAYGIGLDDVYQAPRLLTRRLFRVKPAAICFNSKQSLERYLGMELRNRPRRGIEAGRYVAFGWNPVVWAIPDSSGLASAYWQGRIQLLADLRARLGLHRRR